MRVFLTTALIAVGLTMAPVGSSAATAGLDLAGFADLAVDEAHGHVFVSQGDDTVVVTDLEGTPLTPLAFPGGGARGLALSDDGATLYVALSDADAVAAVDTTTFAVTTFATGQDTCPDDVAVTLGLVWFGTTCPNPFGETPAGPLNALDPDTGTVTLDVGPFTVANARLQTSPADPGSVFVFSRSGDFLWKLSASIAGAPDLTIAQAYEADGHLDQVAVTPDGAHVYVALESGNVRTEVAKLRTSDMTRVGGYPLQGLNNPEPIGVAVRQDGLVAGAILGGSTQLHVWAPDVETPFWSTRADPFTLARRGLAFGSESLYVIAGPRTGAAAVLHVVDIPTVSLTGPSVATTGATVTVVGRLFTDSTNQDLALYAKTAGKPRSLVTSGPVDADLARSAQVTVRKTTMFTLEHTGDGTHPAASATLTLPVRAKVVVQPTRSVRRVGSFYIYQLGTKATIRTTVAPNHSGECVKVTAYRSDGGLWVPVVRVACARLTGGSKVTVSIPSKPSYVDQAIRVRATWLKTDENAKASSGYKYFKFKR